MFQAGSILWSGSDMKHTQLSETFNYRNRVYGISASKADICDFIIACWMFFPTLLNEWSLLHYVIYFINLFCAFSEGTRAMESEFGPKYNPVHELSNVFLDMNLFKNMHVEFDIFEFNL